VAWLRKAVRMVMNRVAFVSRYATVHKMAAPYGLAPKMATPREDPELLKRMIIRTHR